MPPLTFLKAIGFTPVEVSEYRKRFFAEVKESTVLQGKKEYLYDQMAISLMRMRDGIRERDKDKEIDGRKDYEKVWKKIRAHNAASAADRKIVIDRDYIQRLVQSRERGERMNVPKRARRTVKEIADLYGKPPRRKE